MSLFLYEPFYDLERFADALLPSEAPLVRNVRGSERGVTSFKPR
jgi:hypothetical protein